MANVAHSFSDLEDFTGLIERKSKYSVGAGGFADIWIAGCVIQGSEQSVAVKVLRSFRDAGCKHMKKLDKRLRREIIVWKSLKHKNVLPLFGIARDFGPHVSMVCPWMEKGSLTQYLDQEGQDLAMRERLQIIREVASGLAYLHYEGVIHGDLTGSNILLDTGCRVYISDFGFSSIVARFRGTSLDSSTVSGAIRWMAPESVFNNRISKHSDVYSFGSIMYQAFTNLVPYSETKEIHLILQLQSGCHPERPISPPISQAYWDLMVQCWRSSPSERPTINSLRAHLRRLRKSPKYSSFITHSSPSMREDSPLWSSPSSLPPVPPRLPRPSEPSPVLQSPAPRYPDSSPHILRSRLASSPTQLSSPSPPFDGRPLKLPTSKINSPHPLRHAVTWPSPKPSPSPITLRSLTTISLQHPIFKYATCVRCGRTFKKYPGDTEDGDIILIHQSACQYHPGEIVDAFPPYLERTWSCCSSDLKQPGCCLMPQHYSED